MMNTAIMRQWCVAVFATALATACGERTTPTSNTGEAEGARAFSTPPKSMYFSGTLPVSNTNTGAGSTTMTLLPGNQGYQIRVSGFITRTRIPDGNEFQFGPFGQGSCNSSGVKVLDYRGLRTGSMFAGDCSAGNYQRYEWVANVNLAQNVTIERTGGTTTCAPRWSLNPCFVYSGSQSISIIPVNDTNVPTVSLSASPTRVTVGDTVTFTATLGPPGQPTAVSGWQWTDDTTVVEWDRVASPSVSCTGTTCRYAPARSGTMTVTAALRGATATASASVDVGCLWPADSADAPFVAPFWSLLNSRPVRDSLNVLYHASGATGSLPAGDRNEHGMYVHMDDSGHVAIQMVRPIANDLDFGPCSMRMSAAPPAGYTTRISLHIHPFFLNDTIPCRIRYGSDTLYQYMRGPTRQIQSLSDWIQLFVTSGTPLGVVVDRSLVAAHQVINGITIDTLPSRFNPVTGQFEPSYVVRGDSSSNQQEYQRNRPGSCAWPGRGTE